MFTMTERSADLSQCADPSWDYCIPAGGPGSSFHFCVSEPFDDLPEKLQNSYSEEQVTNVDPTWRCGSLENLYPVHNAKDDEQRSLFQFMVDHFHLCTNSPETEIHMTERNGDTVFHVDQNLTCPAKIVDANFSAGGNEPGLETTRSIFSKT